MHWFSCAIAKRSVGNRQSFYTRNKVGESARQKMDLKVLGFFTNMSWLSVDEGKSICEISSNVFLMLKIYRNLFNFHQQRRSISKSTKFLMKHSSSCFQSFMQRDVQKHLLSFGKQDF